MFIRHVVAVLLSVGLIPAPAGAQDTIKLELSPAEVVAIVRAMDRWPISERTPPGFFEVQGKIGRALDKNPDRREEVKELERSR